MAFIEFLLCTHFLYPGPHRFSSVTCVAHLWFLLILGKGLPKFDKVLGLLNLIGVSSLIAVSKSLLFQKASLWKCSAKSLLCSTSPLLQYYTMMCASRYRKQEPPIRLSYFKDHMTRWYMVWKEITLCVLSTFMVVNIILTIPWRRIKTLF